MANYSELSDEDLRQVIVERMGWTDIRRPALLGPDDVAVILARDETGKQHSVPNWPGSVDVALTLFGDTLFRLNHWPKGRYNCMVDPNDWGWHHEDKGYAGADTPARAMCVAWLMYTDVNLSESPPDHGK